jgi:phosphoserine phosphatase
VIRNDWEIAMSPLPSIKPALAALGATVLLATVITGSGASGSAHAAEDRVVLHHWPAAQGEQLSKLMAKFGHEGEYAVFDADNTIWHYDLEEALLPFLEMKGVLTSDNIDPSLKLIPFRADESLYSYYSRLCEIDDKVCYPWIAQVFSGLTLGQLKTYVDELFAYGQPIPTTYYDGDVVVHTTVNPPVIYPGQRELINALHDAGIKVYVMTAASEELVRMVVSDPKYGLNVDTENVLGVTTLLKDPQTGDLTTARKQIEQGHFLDHVYTPEKHASMVVTPYLWTPATWYVGKQAAIMEYIDPYKRPILVAGDSPSDWYMLFYSDVQRGGARVWVNRKQAYTDRLDVEKSRRADLQKQAGVDVDAGDGWITATPAELQ